MKWLGILRPLNLLMVIATQWLMGEYILYPTMHHFGITPALSTELFVILIVISVLITASGYVINDICDVEIDQINKPHKVYIGTFLNLPQGQWLYRGLVATALGLSIYLDWQISHLWVTPVHLLAIILLWLYATKLKPTFLVGNLVVAALTALVPLIIFYAERNALLTGIKAGEKYMYILIGIGLLYGLFSFGLTLYRELVKDIEDAPGDHLAGAHTLPIQLGVSRAKHIGIAEGLGWAFVMIGMGYWGYTTLGNLRLMFFVWGGIAFPLTWSVNLLHKDAYHQSSQWIKVAMLGGLLCLLFFQSPT